MSNPQGGKGNSLGLAVGATNLAGTGDGQRPVIRASAVTLERGVTLTGFVDRVGDPVPMVAQDGSRHRPEILLVEALDGVARTAARTPVSEVAVAVPAHWRPSAVEALRGALRSKPGLARSPLVSDATAALTALRSSPGLPTAGVIVLCDFGGSGAGITLVDAAAEDAPIGDTVRVPDFSGDQIDQAVIAKVVAEVFEASDADPAGTSMVGSLAVLRDECRRGKERLSDETATAIAVDVPGMETTVRMTRKELEGLIDEPLEGFLATLAETLQRNRIPLASISAVATIGGGARIPLITQRLSEHLRATVVTTPQPQLTAAAGAALIAERSQIVETATALAPATPAAPATATVSAAALRDGAAPAVGGARVVGGRRRCLRRPAHLAVSRRSVRAGTRRQQARGSLPARGAGEAHRVASARSGFAGRAGGGGGPRRRCRLRPGRHHPGHLDRSGGHVVRHRPGSCAGCPTAGARGPGAGARHGARRHDRGRPSPAAVRAAPAAGPRGAAGTAALRPGSGGSRPSSGGSRACAACTRA
ncbi:Hsp70 family protein [Mycobacterium sp. ITM-2016-00318]|uniref:Hsp70 family protein n=1 Tax=Mycobacterium sp. ITM-2016-00318 TaxID=2099693 RepID=UPI000CF96D50|nr:Hsp70 family protein [Mycobacterium sp. ITM-2016-00318]WNG93257.1 Hsp70 family protein [Mycobacterium sp. ITM-2016-00318]